MLQQEEKLYIVYKNKFKTGQYVNRTAVKILIN